MNEPRPSAPWSMEGRRALVVGAGSGIGRAVASVLAEAGAALRCIDIDEAAVKTVAGELAGRGFPVSWSRADATEPASITAAVDDFAKASTGTIDAVVSTVGIVGRIRLEDCSVEQWEKVLGINVRSGFLVAKASMPYLQARGGAMVLLSSRAALHGVRGTPAYSAAKGAVSALVQQLAVDYGWDGVRINALAPSTVEDTGMFASRADRDPARRRFLETVPLCHYHGRLIQSRDVAHAALFLVSDMGKMITGQTLLIDAGQGGWDGMPSQRPSAQ